MMRKAYIIITVLAGVLSLFALLYVFADREVRPDSKMVEYVKERAPIRAK